MKETSGSNSLVEITVQYSTVQSIHSSFILTLSMDSPIFQTKFARNMSIMCKLSYTELPREVILKVKIYPKRKAIEHKTYFLSQPIDVRTFPLLHLFITIFCCANRTSVYLHPSSAALGVQSQSKPTVRLINKK